MTSPPAPVWVIPDPISTHGVQVDEETVILLRRHGNPEGPRIILSHGNGLAIDLFYPFWSLLTRDFDLIVHDLRNHGRNEVGPLKYHSFSAFARDHDQVSETIDSLYGEKPTVGVFHSISALASLHTSSRGCNYSALVLFAPPLCNEGFGYREFEVRARRTADMLRRRAQWFRSREELAELHKYLPHFRRAVPGVLDLVAETTLKESPSGSGFELCCPSEYEARIWDNASRYAASVDFGTLKCPIKVVESDPALMSADVPTFDYGGVCADHDFIAGTSHFLQLEKPEECASALLRFLEQLKIL